MDRSKLRKKYYVVTKGQFYPHREQLTGAPVTHRDNECYGKAEEGEVPVIW